MAEHIIKDSQTSEEELQQLYAEAKTEFLRQFYADQKRLYLKGFSGRARKERLESFRGTADVAFLKAVCGIGFADLDLIFNIANANRDLFPQIRLGTAATVTEYLVRWIGGYFSAAANPPSKHTAKPKSSCSDPAVRKIVQETQELTSTEVNKAEAYHNLFMSAENIQGNLLEEYIARNVRPYGYLWCRGNILRAIDFCSIDGADLIQIKNKDNSENSSSSNIRAGTAITKWFRLSTKHTAGIALPYYNWADLNCLISTNRTSGHELGNCHMSEEGYLSFLKEIASANHQLITDL